MKTADPELMRAINRFHVLDTIRRHGAIARVEIGERTDLSATTVSAITAALLDDGLITVRHEGDIRSQTLRGRPRVMLALNPQAAWVVGAKLAANRIVFVATNFQGDVLASLTLPVRVDRLPAEVIADLVEDGVRRCVLDAGLVLGQIKTIALSLPGIVEHGTGKVLASGILRDPDVSLKQAIATRMGIDTIIESDANAISMAQHWFGRARDLDDFVLVAVEETLGLGVMHGGQLFRGAHGLSLTLGDMIMGAGGDNAVKLADLASQQVILQSSQSDQQIGEAVRLGQGMAPVRRLVDAGDEGLCLAAARAGAALGIAIANLVALFAPPRVILVGSTLALGEHLLAPLRAAFANAIPAPLTTLAEIVIDESGDELWARGAAAVALGELYGSPWGTTGPVRRAPQ
ncbi:MAG: ROK family transcriptional regulator [Alphaproteobacteria bacterium]|nr:ROK family transcriptional regulator [Alphaproteobacteria bacterium]MBU1561363.1 ROK family transcriptional regulator [Alphaproteobacteria bacterium]MBU2303907.1 ROK family transcriptional regulator [Alphaproteobacteria bacterium]MBU2366492.1 ROK family transcriptional regulator [Alphaproteobacteria bacterium]